MHFYVTGYKFDMMVLVSLSFIVALTLLEEALNLTGLGLERFGLDNNTAF